MITQNENCDGLGDVIIRTLKWSQQGRLQELADDPYMLVPVVLGMAVIDDKGDPIKSEDEWDDFIGCHRAAALELYRKCMKLNDFDGSEAVKK